MVWLLLKSLIVLFYSMEYNLHLPTGENQQAQHTILLCSRFWNVKSRSAVDGPLLNAMASKFSGGIT